MEKEQVLDSGIVLTTKDQHEAQRAKVLAVGPAVEYVKVGDSIIPNWNSAEPTKFKKEDYFLVKEEEVVMIVEE
jgi:co-chaperonin GroES (HSP10)